MWRHVSYSREVARLALACVVIVAVAVAAAAIGVGVHGAAARDSDGLIAFTRQSGTGSGQVTTVMTVRADGTGTHAIGRGWGPTWLGDGSRLVFYTTYRRVRGLFTTTPRLAISA